jgi:tRNA nucleotidyltransferase (CCA-adding enzyme)
VETPTSGPGSHAADALPACVRGLALTLLDAGHASFLVGGCVRDLVSGRTPHDFDLATAAAPDDVLTLFPRAIPIGIRHGTVMIPTPGGPVDVTSFRGPDLEGDLARRDFTVNAIALDVRDGSVVDPFDGLADLAAHRLRAVVSARDRFAEDPLRALRAARLAATLGLEVDADVESAMSGAVAGLRRVARERIRRELAALLLAPGVANGLALLRRTGIESELAPRAAADAGPVIAALPFDLELRLAAWLRGARGVAVLRGLRFPRRSVDRVERILRVHPVDLGVSLAEGSVRRLVKRAGEHEIAGLLALRRAELVHGAESAAPEAPGALERLERLEAAVGAVRRAGRLALARFDLAIDGQDAMRILGCGPGPRVGRALSYLTDRVVDDPALNTREALEDLLRTWKSGEAHAAGASVR